MLFFGTAYLRCSCPLLLIVFASFFTCVVPVPFVSALFTMSSYCVVRVPFVSALFTMSSYYVVHVILVVHFPFVVELSVMYR